MLPRLSNRLQRAVKAEAKCVVLRLLILAGVFCGTGQNANMRKDILEGRCQARSRHGLTQMEAIICDGWETAPHARARLRPSPNRLEPKWMLVFNLRPLSRLRLQLHSATHLSSPIHLKTPSHVHELTFAATAAATRHKHRRAP